MATSANGGGYAGPAFELQTLIPRFFVEKGILNPVTVTNLAIGGTSIWQMNALPYVASADCIYIKYGINDAGRGVTQFATDLNNQLAAIRGAAGGDVSRLTIVLVGPNSTYDATSGRNATWYEKLRGIYVAAARKYRCFYFDAYAYLQDSSRGALLWLSDDYGNGNGNGIHPLGMSQAWIHGAVFREIFSDFEVVDYWRGNNFNAYASWNGLASPSAPPSSYKFGLTIQRTGAGFPVDGAIETTQQADGVARQTCWNYTNGVTRAAVRTGDPISDTWSSWAGQDITPSLLNGWVNFGTGYDPITASLDEYAYVTLHGNIKAGTTTIGTQIMQLPVNYRPLKAYLFVVATLSAGNVAGTAVIRVDPSGSVSNLSTLDANLTALGSISFRTY